MPVVITLYVCSHTIMSSLGMAQDCFKMANQQAGQRLFTLHKISADGKSVTINGATIDVDGDLASAAASDLLLIPAIGSQVQQVIANNTQLLTWLAQYPQKQLASVCSAAFLLATAGVLDGHRATTHWGLAEQFQQQFPQVRLETEQLMTHDRLRFCSGGAQAGIDLCLYLIRLFASDWLARQVASVLVMDYGRGLQTRFVPRLLALQNKDLAVARLQRWLEQNYAQALCLEDMAAQLHCSSRTLMRRFKDATQLTPHDYLQRVRISAAESFLAENQQSVEQIAVRVGYENRTAFAKLFKQLTGETPAAYRRLRQSHAEMSKI